jgi:hypothetical protein
MSETQPIVDPKELLGLQDRRQPTPFFVKAWGRSVLLRDPSAADRDEWDIYQLTNKGQNVAWRAKVCQMLIVNEKDERIFSERDIPALGQKDAAALHEIWNEGTKRLAIGEDEVEELEKN